MKPSIKTILIAIILSVILFIIGVESWGSIFTLLLPIVGDVKYASTDLGSMIQGSLLFSLALALIPIVTVLIWKFASVETRQKKALTVLIILVTITSFVVIRREMIKYQARHIQPTTVLDYSDPANPQPKAIEVHIPVSTLNFELYALAGLVAGSLISFFTLRERTAQ